MDPRIDIHRLFQLNPGDVFVLRNAGNFQTLDTLRSILLSIANYNIEIIIVLGHFDCGMTRINLSELRSKLPYKFLSRLTSSNSNLIHELKSFFKPFANEIQNVIEQIKRLETIKDLYPEIEIIGMIYDVKNGWVINYEEFKDLRSENFTDRYNEIIQEKNLQLMNYVGDNSEEIKELSEDGEVIDVISKKEIEEINVSNIESSEIIKPMHDDDMKNLIKMPKIQVPKIHITKVKIYKPLIKKSIKN